MKLSITIPLFTLLLIGWSQKDDPIKVLILQAPDGHNIHYQAEVFQKILNRTGNYDIQTFFLSEEQGWDDFNFRFSDFKLIVSSSLGQNMPDNLRQEFDQYVNGGGNLLLIHNIVGSFLQWPKFHEMLGMGYYGGSAGLHLFLDQEEKLVKAPIYHGVGTGHARQHEFLVKVRDPDHPVMKDMPAEWLHSMDEQFIGLRGPAENLEVLATAYSDKKYWGSGDHEPVVWTVRYGQGRVFVTVLGHIILPEMASFVPGIDLSENKTKALHSVGFQTLVARGAEWAATGKVTIPIPSGFPGNKESSTIPPEEVNWKK